MLLIRAVAVLVVAAADPTAVRAAAGMRTDSLDDAMFPSHSGVGGPSPALVRRRVRMVVAVPRDREAPQADDSMVEGCGVVRETRAAMGRRRRRRVVVGLQVDEARCRVWNWHRGERTAGKAAKRREGRGVRNERRW